MTSLITGGAGFIGSHLAEALVARGEEVIVLDDLSTGSVENLRHLRTHPSLHCFFESVRDRRLLAELVDESEVVFHLAAAVGVRRIIESPVRTIETNVGGTELVLEAAAKKTKLVFVASTSEVYGKNANAPFREDDDIVLGPTAKSRWSYATSKALDEFMALAYWKEKKLPVVIGRLVTQRPQSASAFRYIPYDEAYEPGFEDMARRVPSLEKLVRLIGFRPSMPLTKIIDDVVAHFGARRSVPPTERMRPVPVPQV